MRTLFFTFCWILVISTKKCRCRDEEVTRDDDKNILRRRRGASILSNATDQRFLLSTNSEHDHHRVLEDNNIFPQKPPASKADNLFDRFQRRKSSRRGRISRYSHRGTGHIPVHQRHGGVKYHRHRGMRHHYRWRRGVRYHRRRRRRGGGGHHRRPYHRRGTYRRRGVRYHRRRGKEYRRRRGKGYHRRRGKGSQRLRKKYGLYRCDVEDLLGHHHEACYRGRCHFDAIVVGAGMSGLAAAATLLERGKKVLVLEGRHEVGGRMRTMSGFGEPAGAFTGTIELGANWFYGGYGNLTERDDPSSGPVNPMKNFALDAGVDFMEQLFNGRGIDMHDVTGDEPIRFPFVRVRNTLQNFRPLDRCLGNKTVDELFTLLGDNPELAANSRTYREVLNDECGWTAETPMDEVLEVAYYDNEVLSLPEDASELSSVPWGYDDFGDQVLFVYGQNGGMTEVARKYAENNDVLPRIVFNANVTRINYKNHPARITVDISKIPHRRPNRGDHCYIDTKKVIFTGSQGIVDKFKDTLFDPPVTNTNLRQVELRTWVKVFLQFPRAFWNEGPIRDGPNDIFNFNYIFTAEEDNRQGCNIFFNFDFENDVASEAAFEPGRYTLLPGSRLLMGWMPQHIMDEFGGQENYVFDYENFEEGGDIERLVRPLKKAFPENFTMPNYAFATNWQDDKCTFGSWNSFKVDPDLDNNDYYEFYEPRNRRLWLSGASSCRRHYRNVHGAYFAGIRDGHWVADCLEAKSGWVPKRPESICDVYDVPLTSEGEGEG